MPDTNVAGLTQPRNSSTPIKPLTDAELLAKERGEVQLYLARSYRERGDHESALNCCVMGLRLTYGIPRPLAVRDQLHEMARQIDPTFGQSA